MVSSEVRAGIFQSKRIIRMRCSQILDERGKEYDAIGDSDVTESVNDLVRGVLAPAVFSILQHVSDYAKCYLYYIRLEQGIRRSPVLGGVWHPWAYIEQVRLLVVYEKCIVDRRWHLKKCDVTFARCKVALCYARRSISIKTEKC